MNRKLRGLSCLSLSVLATGFFGAGCGTDPLGNGPLGDIAEQCGLACAAEGVAEGNGSISGVASLDAFFGSVARFNGAASAVSDGIQAELDGIAVSVGLKPGAAAADIKGAIQAKLTANIDGGLKIVAEPPKCTVSASATLEAQAKCDASVKPGTASVKCEGSCTAEADVAVDCGASAELKCTGTAPSLACEGTCKGDCELTASAACSGTCSGTCTGTCSVKDASGNCAGSCDGTCQGTCKLEAGGSCSGSCKGSCEFTPPSGKCEGGAEAHCDATGTAQVECKGTCSGTVEPPEAKAECQASAKADASVSAECKPPSLSVSFQLKASVAGDATAAGEFSAWLEGFKGHIAGILAFKAKADGLVKVGGQVAASAEAAITGSIDDIKASGDLDLKVTAGLACAITELPKAVALLGTAGTKLKGSVSGAVTVLGTAGL